MEVVRYHHLQHGHKAALIVGRGRKFLKVLTLDHTPMSVETIPLESERYMTPMTYKGGPYPEDRALRHFRAASKRLGSTKSARQALGWKR